MEIVVKISEGDYQLLKDGHIPFNILGKMRNGTPLPKGHGDLIDRKDLIENGISKGFCDWYDEITMADTIIEADKEVQDEDSD